jgi:hypothetical protein
MLRADADARDTPDGQAGPSATLRSVTRPTQDQARDQRRPDAGADRSAGQDQHGSASRPQDSGITRPVLRPVQSQIDQARTVARELAPAGRTVSRTLIITVGGTLAANLATVILVGAALAFVHFSKTRSSKPSGLLNGTLIFAGSGLVGIAVGSFYRWRLGFPRIGRAMIAGCLLELMD